MIQKDRNFDKLIDRFEQKVYETAKGDWRLKLLKGDLQFLQDSPQKLTLWDAGCGLAQVSLWFAENGHRLTLCDISKKMLSRSQQAFKNADLQAEFFKESAQILAPRLPQFDVILFHAVLEWLVEPMPSLHTICRQVKPGGYLSLLFYNRNAMIFKNALRGGWRLKNLLDDSYLGKGRKLTPPNPQYPDEVISQLEQWGFSVTTYTGVRVFHDYLDETALESSDVSELFDLEYRYCRSPTFRGMGRYVHLLLQRKL